MRISTQGLFQQGLSAIQGLSSTLSKTQLQVATGRRVLQPADDPIAAARMLGLDAAIAQNTQYQRNAGIAQNRLALEEQVLTDVQNVLMRVRDLAVQAGNDTQGPEGRDLIAVEVAGALNQLVQLGNTRDGEGRYIFSGYQSNTQPFIKTGGSVTYAGDQGQRMLLIGENRQVADSDPGSAVFQQVRNGNGTFTVNATATNTGTGVIGATSVTDRSLWDGGFYSIQFTSPDAFDVVEFGGGIVTSGVYGGDDTIEFNGVSVAVSGAPQAGDSFAVGPAVNQDIFATVQQFVDALGMVTEDPVDMAQFHNAVNGVMIDLDQGLGNILATRTRVGTRLRTVDVQQDSNQDFALVLSESRATLEDLDYSEAITRLNLQLTQLEAAQQSFVRVQGLSLFNRL